MKMILKNQKKNRIISKRPLKDNKGTTLVEMIVTFALLSIFLAASAMIISTITKMYYQTKGETYSKQIGDILMEKVASEIEGAQYDKTQPGNNPKIDDVEDKKNGTSIRLYDRTDTNVMIRVQDNRLVLDYAAITGSASINRNATTWKFDDVVYNGFDITDFQIIRGDALNSSNPDSATLVANAEDYGITGDVENYGKDIYLVLLSIHNEKYGEYKFFRFVRLYKYEE